MANPFPTLQSLAVITLWGLLYGCTPLPSVAPPSQVSPRPVAPLPVEKLLRASPSPGVTKSASPTPGKAPGSKSARSLSAAEVKTALDQAEDKAVGAANLAQSAQSKEDWNLVIKQWQRAIALLPPVSTAGAQKAIVQQKLTAYQAQLTTAQQQAKVNPRQLVTDGQRPTGKGAPLIIAPASPSPSPSASASPSPSPSPSASPAQP